MKKVAILFLLIGRICLSQTDVSGTLSSNTTWNVGGSPYIVIDDIYVMPNDTLTIEPGVVIKIDGDKSIGIKGSLRAVGTNDNYIRFTKNNSTNWDQIKFDTTNDSSFFDYCIIEFGSDAIEIDGAYFTYSPKVSVTNSYIHSNSGTGIKTYYNSGGIYVRNTVIRNNGNGISANWCFNGVSIKNSIIADNNGTGFSGTVSSFSINKNQILRNSTGIFFTSNQTSYIKLNNIVGNTIGMYNNYTNGTNNTTVDSNNFDNSNYNFENGSSSSFTFENNWWGSTNNDTINASIIDIYENTDLGLVDYDPFLTAPNTDAPPIPAQNLKLDSQTVTSATFSWDASKMGDIAGYKFYYDTDSSGYPYANSVDLGNVVTKSLTGLTTGKKYYVAVTTYDTDGNESWYSKEVAVQLNNKPVIAAVSDVTINEDKTSTVTLSATDADGDAITYSAVSDTNAVTISVSSATLTLTPNANWHGVATIKAYASDGYSKDSTSFKLTVTSVNDAPTLTAITETLSTDEETVLKVAFKGEDVDGDDLTYAYASDTSGVAATHNTAKDSLVLTPVTDFFGNAVITVTVSDGSLSDTSSFTLNVININDAPVLSGIQNQTINEDEVIVVKLTATDLDGDVLTYSGIADTSAVTVTASNDTLKLTPKADWNGTSVITAIVSDGTISDSTSFTLNVNPVQDVPYPFDWVSPNERDTINVDKNNTATEYVFKWNSSKDVDGDALTYHFYIADTLIEVLSDTTTAGTYQDFLDHWPLQFQMLPRMTFTFNVWVHDGTDSVKVTGEPRKVLVNRYENLSTEGEGIPTEFALHENYPNPFNPTTTLRFDLPEVSDITLTIYNMLGQKVRTFNYQNTSAGYHSVKWNATNDYGDPVGAGVYLYQLQTKDFVKTRKMVLLK